MLIRYPEGGGRCGKAFHRKQSNGRDRHSCNNVSGAGRRSRRVWRQLVRPTGIWPFDLHRALHLRAGGMFRAFPAAGCLVGRESSAVSWEGRSQEMAYRRGGGGVTGRVDVWKAAWELNGPLVTGVLGTPPPAHTRGTGRWEKMRRGAANGLELASRGTAE